MKKAKRATISDIAEKSGYSKTAVSFAFNCPNRISEQARERILAVAKELDYMPDPMARNFSLGKHMSIGFLLPQVLESALDNPFTQKVIIGMGKICEENGYGLTLIPPLHSSIAEAVKNATVDGIISMGILFDPGITEALRRRKMPVVTIDGNKEEGISSVTIDDEDAAEMQMRAALEKGHRNIAIISLPEDAYGSAVERRENTAERRMRGYIKALRDYGVDESTVDVRSSDVSLIDGRRTAFETLTEKSPTCFVCMSDIAAMGAMSAIKDKGMECPKDVSVIGFDGIIDPELTGIDLTTIIQDPVEKGRMAAELLFSIIAGDNSDKHLESGYTYHEGRTLAQV